MLCSCKLFLIFKFSNLMESYIPTSLVAERLKHLPAMQETWVRSLGWEDPLEKGKATHASILAWRIPWSPWGCKELDTTKRFSLCVTLGPFWDITQYSWVSPMYTEGIHADKVWVFLVSCLLSFITVSSQERT